VGNDVAAVHLAIVGCAGNTFGTSMDDCCRMTPDALASTGELFLDENVSGNVYVSMDSNQVDGATIRIEESLSFEGTQAFCALY